MPAFAWQPLVAATELLQIIAWGLPLLLLTALSYFIEEYTKFRTRWRLLVLATLLSFIKPLVMGYEHLDTGVINPLHETILNVPLLIGIGIGVYTSINLLTFQKLRVGKTRDVVDILIAVGVVIPLMARFDGRIPNFEMWDLTAYNLSIAMLVLIFLVIGKTIRNYIPRHGKTMYALVVLASLLLPVNMLLKNYSCMALKECEAGKLITFGVGIQSIGNFLLAFVVLLLIREAKIRGTHLTPAEERKTDLNPMKFRLKKGFGYLLNDVDGKRGFEIFNEYIAHKFHGLGITRTKPELIRDEYGLRTTPILWMTTAETEDKTVRPTDLERLLLVIKDFISNGGGLILFIERLDYLIAENGFGRVLNFIYRLNDLIVSSDCILVVSTNFDTLTREQVGQLVQEFKDLGGAGQVVLNDGLYAMLDFIYSENGAGRRPSFRKITDTFGITKTTTRKRVYDLMDKRLIRVVEDGKFKLLEVTEEGRTVMKSPVGPRGW